VEPAGSARKPSFLERGQVGCDPLPQLDPDEQSLPPDLADLLCREVAEALARGIAEPFGPLRKPFPDRDLERRDAGGAGERVASERSSGGCPGTGGVPPRS
jgi:hypothetical protein